MAKPATHDGTRFFCTGMELHLRKLARDLKEKFGDKVFISDIMLDGAGKGVDTFDVVIHSVEDVPAVHGFVQEFYKK